MRLQMEYLGEVDYPVLIGGQVDFLNIATFTSTSKMPCDYLDIHSVINSVGFMFYRWVYTTGYYHKKRKDSHHLI